MRAGHARPGSGESRPAEGHHRRRRQAPQRDAFVVQRYICQLRSAELVAARARSEAQLIRAGRIVRRTVTWRTMILVALRTGMRQGELLALRWEDVDLVAGR